MLKIPGKVERAEGRARLPFWIWYALPSHKSSHARTFVGVFTSLIRKLRSYENAPPPRALI